MKSVRAGIIFAAAVITAAFVGCNKAGNNLISDITLTPTQAVQTALAKADTALAFDESDSATVDDQTVNAMEVSSLGKILTPVHLFRWGRKIESSTRTISVSFTNDSVAIVTLKRTMVGHLLVQGSLSDSTGPTDTIVVRKPFTQTATRKIEFDRVQKTLSPENDWRAVAMTLSVGVTVPDSLNKFTLKSIEVDVDTQSFQITDPTNTWLPLKRLRKSVPVLHVGDSVTVTLTVDSQDDSNEVAILRHGVGARDLIHYRTRMGLVNTTDLGGGMTERVYRRVYHVLPLPAGVLIGRYNATVEAMSHGSLYDDATPFSDIYCGMPYFVIR